MDDGEGEGCELEGLSKRLLQSIWVEALFAEIKKRSRGEGGYDGGARDAMSPMRLEDGRGRERARYVVQEIVGIFERMK